MNSSNTQRRMRWSAIAALLLVIVAGMLYVSRTHAQVSEQPGYVEFGDFSLLSDEPPKVEISLGAALLGFLSAATEEEDAELANTLSRLQSIRVSVLEVDEDKVDSTEQFIAGIASDLEGQGWERAVLVRDEEATVHMYMKMVDGHVAGMTVMMAGDDNDAVFMNIVGDIEPKQLGRVAAKFGVPLDLGG